MRDRGRHRIKNRGGDGKETKKEEQEEMKGASQYREQTEGGRQRESCLSDWEKRRDRRDKEMGGGFCHSGTEDRTGLIF
jgi:hypothetical protein